MCGMREGCEMMARVLLVEVNSGISFTNFLRRLWRGKKLRLFFGKKGKKKSIFIPFSKKNVEIFSFAAEGGENFVGPCQNLLRGEGNST